MEDNPTLKVLLDSLFSTNALSSWNIYNDKNNCVNVRLRFTKLDEENNIENVSFRRKSDNQVRRDRQRAAHHQTTQIARSKTEDKNSDVSLELPRFTEETFVSETGLIGSPVSVPA